MLIREKKIFNFFFFKLQNSIIFKISRVSTQILELAYSMDFRER